MSRFAFFRQSGWMLITTLAGGVMFAAVQIVAQRMPGSETQEYALFSTLMDALGQLTIPALGLQTIFAQQMVLAQTEQQRREFSGTVRGVLRALVLLWLVLAGAAFCYQRQILTVYKIQNPAALWFTLVLALAGVISPVFYGVLQGRQNFLWLGWANMANSAGRLLTVAMVVLVLGGTAVGVMGGVLAGALVSLTLLVWQGSSVLRGLAAPVAWRPWLRRVVPLTLGLGVPTYMFTQDIITVREFFSEGTDAYTAARVVGRVLVFLTVPMTAVMFPKIVQSAAGAGRTNVFQQAMGLSLLIGILGALGCTLFPELPFRILTTPTKLWGLSSLVPWFAWCMLPLALANVLVSNLMAREGYAVAPWLVMVAAGYGVTLHFFHTSFLQVVQVFGIFSALLLFVCLLFTWRLRTRATESGK